MKKNQEDYDECHHHCILSLTRKDFVNERYRQEMAYGLMAQQVRVMLSLVQTSFAISPTRIPSLVPNILDVGLGAAVAARDTAYQQHTKGYGYEASHRQLVEYE